MSTSTPAHSQTTWTKVASFKAFRVIARFCQCIPFDNELFLFMGSMRNNDCYLYSFGKEEEICPPSIFSELPEQLSLHAIVRVPLPNSPDIFKAYFIPGARLLPNDPISTLHSIEFNKKQLLEAANSSKGGSPRLIKWKKLENGTF